MMNLFAGTKHTNQLVRICTAVLLVVIMQACKKGADDPAFTFASRSARMEGSWKFSSGQVTLKINRASGQTGENTYIFTDAGYKITIGGIGTYEGPHFLKLTMSKDGRCVLEERIDSVTLKANGSWDFLGKGDDFKNKERVVFTLESAVGNSIVDLFFNKMQSTFVYGIRELRKDRLVLETKEEIIFQKAGGDKYTVTSEYIFLQ
jgi:hypothetical protein